MIGACEQHQQLTMYPGNDPSSAGWSYYGAAPGKRLHKRLVTSSQAMHITIHLTKYTESHSESET